MVRKTEFDGDTWLHYPALRPDIAIIRATTADENGNLTFEQEGAMLGAMEMALARITAAARSSRRCAASAPAATLRPHDVKVPGILIDAIVEAPGHAANHRDPYDPAISGEVFRRCTPSAAPSSISAGHRPPRRQRVARRLGGEYRLWHLGQRARILLEEATARSHG